MSVKVVLAIAPHPDDETLGCGGTLLRHAAEGANVHWLIATRMLASGGWTPDSIETREREIDEVARHYGFAGVHRLDFPVARLDTVPLQDLVGAIGAVVKSVAPDTLYVPNGTDAHSDHRAVFDASLACAKWFRYPSVRRVRVYETLSETEMAFESAWRPGLFVDIGQFLDRKIAAMQLYKSEIAAFPFPRSETTIRALAQLRGSTVGVSAAEAFVSLLEIVPS